MLYKYVGPDRIDLLKNHCIRYSQPEVFNDPFEFKPFISKIASEETVQSQMQEELPAVLRQTYSELPAEIRASMTFEQFMLKSKKIMEHIPHVNGIFNTLTQIVRQQVSEQLANAIGILSLTETPDNLLMWAHYANSHEGFVIGFDNHHPYFDERRGPQDEFHYLRKVEYRKQRPNTPMIELTGTELFLVKSEQWSYENEWRILRPLQDANQVIEKALYPIHLFAFPPEIIREIIIGCRMPEEIRSQIVQTVKWDEQYQDVEILQAKPDEQEFRLILRK